MSSSPNLPLISLALLAIWVIWKLYQRFRLSPLDNIAGPPANSFLNGNFTQFLTNNTTDYQIGLIKKYGKVIRFKFVFGEDILLLSDPKALQSVLVKDQDIYEELPDFLIISHVAFGPGLTATVGEQHRKQRKILNPIFANSHLKEMVPIISNVAYKLRAAVANNIKEGPKEVDLLDWMSRTTLEIVGQTGFGCSFDGLTEDSTPHPFAVYVKHFEAMLNKLIFARLYLLPILSSIGTRKSQSYVVRALPWKIIRENVELVDNMHKTSVDIINSRKVASAVGEKATDTEIGKGKDMISILLRANDRVETRDKLSDEELIAQVSTFIFTAIGATSSALARSLWILAQRQDAQDKLRLEIREARKAREDITYDDLMGLPYLDAICKETLRLYPPVASMARTTRQDMVLPLGTPIKGLDETQIKEIPIPKGTRIFVNIVGCNIDPAIWGEDSHEWKPERWLQPLPDSVSAARIPGVFSNLMTFLGGGRACIGFKTSQLQIKMILLSLIESFKFSPSPDKEVYWRAQGIAKPSVVGFSDYRLPLVVERAA